MLRIFFNPFEYIFLGFYLDLQGLPKDLPGFSLANPCKSLQIQRKSKEMYSNGLKNILKII